MRACACASEFRALCCCAPRGLTPGFELTAVAGGGDEFRSRPTIGKTGCGSQSHVLCDILRQTAEWWMQARQGLCALKGCWRECKVLREHDLAHRVDKKLAFGRTGA